MNKRKLNIYDLSLSKEGALQCPDCGGFLTHNSGMYEHYWGCSNRTESGCRFSLKYYGTLNETLSEIIENDNIEELKKYMKSGARYALDKNGNSLLMLSVLKRRNDMSVLLIESGVAINQENEDGYTPLMLSVVQEDEELAKKLIDANADTCKTNNDGNTALMLALLEHPEFDYKILLKKDCRSVYIRNRKKVTPLKFALKENLKGIILEFINAGVKIDGDILRWAIETNYIEFIKRYFVNTNVNAHDTAGNTYLMYSIMNNSTDCVEFFLGKGADIFYCNKNGDCALTLARKNKNPEILEMVNKYKETQLSNYKLFR